MSKGEGTRMQIRNNSSALAALGELTKNNTELGKQLQKVSSGMKINGAGDGASEYAISEITGTVNVTAGQNIEIRQADPSTPLQDVYINGPKDGNANIWINGLNIENLQDASIIKFYETGNHLTIMGDNTIQYPSTTTNYNCAVVNAGKGLTLEGAGTLNIIDSGSASCAGIGTDEDDHTSLPNITINSGTYNISVSMDGAAIGTSVRSDVGNITINGGTLNLSSVTSAGIGGTGDTLRPDMTLNRRTSTGNITIGRNAVVTAHSEWSAGIGSGCMHGYTKGIKISKYATVSATSTYGEGIGRGVSGTVGSVDLAWDDSDMDYDTTWSLERETNPLAFVIHHGTKANQATKVFINDMQPSALGLDDVKVVTRYAAVTSLSKLDSAIDYATNENARMGAYQTRLDFTIANLTTSSENTQSSESTIRDADMAKEMTAYTKANVLAQSAQAMLAQANQNASGVLGLLQG